MSILGLFWVNLYHFGWLGMTVGGSEGILGDWGWLWVIGAGWLGVTGAGCPI